MLEALRSFLSGWVAKLLLVLLIGSFALWGVSGSILGGTDTTTVARVGETGVSVREYLTAYNNSMNQLQQTAGRRLTRDEGKVFGVESQTLNSVISLATLDEFVREENISLSDKTLARLIADNTAFQDSTGKFNRDTFRRAVGNAQMRESDFIISQNKAATRSQLSRAFMTGKLMPDVFNNALSAYTSEERKFAYLTITTALSGEPKAPDESELKTYFEANKKNYKAPEYRKLVILAVQPKDLADEKAISEEDVRSDYQDRLASYSKPEERRVQQIVFKSSDAAQTAIKSLTEGALFETILSEQKLKISDADLGLMSKKQMPKAIQDAAFSLVLNTPSEIIKGPFGPTLIRITEINEAKVTSLEEVKDDIRKDLALRNAANEIVTMQEKIEDMRAGGANIAEIAIKLGIKSRLVEAIDRTARTPKGAIINDLPASKKLIAQAFTTAVGDQQSPIDVGEAGYVWVDVEKITPTRDKNFDEVADKVKADWLKKERANLITKKADELKTRLLKGATLEAIATELKTEAAQTGYLKRSTEDGNFKREANLAGFAGDAKHIAIVAGAKDDEKLLITVAEIKRPESQVVKIPEREAKIANEGAAEDLMTQLIRNLQAGYKITQNPTLINQALTQGY
ncbi:MAG: SurA N-terminal domain-containing protein [Rhizobiaceae bacterium]